MTGGPGRGPAAQVLAANVARRYYLDGATKRDIATELGLSRFKVARLLDQARETGIVRIELDSPSEIDLDLSVRLENAYGLRHSVVLDMVEKDDEQLRSTLGRAAADLLVEIVEPGDVLGLAWARALLSMRESLKQLPRCDVVQLTGALTVPEDDSPMEVVREVARSSEGEAFVYYAPMILPDAETARTLRRQPEVARAVSRFGAVTKAVVGVGGWRKGQSSVASTLEPAEVSAIHALGVRAELSGVQLDAAGNAVATPLTERVIGIEAAQLQAVPEVIGVVYNTSRAAAVHAALRGGYVTSVVTHPALARALLDRA